MRICDHCGGKDKVLPVRLVFTINPSNQSADQRAKNADTISDLCFDCALALAGHIDRMLAPAVTNTPEPAQPATSNVFMVRGNQGVLVVNKKTWEVQERIPNVGEYGNIVRFDVGEYERWYGKPIADCDILSIGYWYMDGIFKKYEHPSMDLRKSPSPPSPPLPRSQRRVHLKLKCKDGRRATNAYVDGRCIVECVATCDGGKDEAIGLAMDYLLRKNLFTQPVVFTLSEDATA